MSNKRPHNSIESALKRVRPRDWLLAVPAALLSALSVSVFCFMRASAESGLYYSGERNTLLLDSVSITTLAIALGLTLFYALAFRVLHKPRLGSAVISLLMAFNMTVSLSMEHSDLKEIFLPTGVVGNVLVLLGFAVLLYTCIELVYLAFDHKTRYRIWADDQRPTTNGELFLGAYGCIMLLWLPILFIFYPGSVMNDTRYQIMGWLGLKPITASHPVLTTVFYGALYQIGAAMQGQAKGIFLALLFQALVTAAAMGLTASCVYRYTKSRAWFWATVAFFGVLPVWQSAAQALLGDVLHTGCFLLFVCVYLKCIREREKSWRNVLLLLLTAILVAYTRRATFCLAVICILVAALWHWRSFLLPYLGMLAVFMGLFWFSNNVLYPWLNIAPELKSENYSLQFQQVALYCRTYQDEMTVEEKAIVDSTLDYDKIIEAYTPMISDEVKSTFHDTELPHDDFWQLYRQMLRRHPMLFVKAAIMGSFEHFNPWFEGINFRVYIARQDDFLTVDYKYDLHETVAKFWDTCLHIPVLRLLIGTGLYTWVLLVMLAYGIRKKSLLAFLGLIPSLALMIGLVMSHVNGEIRYGYPLIAVAPLNMAWVMYAVSRNSPDNPYHGKYLRQEEKLEFDFLKGRSKDIDTVLPEDFDPEKQQPELPPEEKPADAPGWKAGPVLRFVTRFIPVPKNPKTYLDILKVLAIFLVLWNYTEKGFELYNEVLEMPQHLVYLCFSIFDKIAVPLFFMCSGALLLGREESVHQILTRRVRHFALVLLVVSAITYVYYYSADRNFSAYDFIVRLYSGKIRTPLWYLYSYLAFLLTLPFLRKLARTMREKDYFWLLGLYLLTELLSVADYFWFRGTDAHSRYFVLFISQNYVIYTLFGFYIDRVMKKERMNLETATLLIIASALAIGSSYMLTEWKMASAEVWTAAESQTFFNTFISIPSITVFFIAKCLYMRRPVTGRAAAIWSLLSTGTFGTYLFERYWRDTTWFAYETATRKLSPFASSFIHILVAAAMGILATLVYKLLTGMFKSLFRMKKDSRIEKRREKEKIVYTVPKDDISDLEEIETLLVGNARHYASAKTGKDQAE